jgi:hypothetical protein
MNRLLIPLFIAMLALTACRSGDTIGGFVPAEAQPTPSGFTITSANALSVTQESWGASVQSADLVGLFGSSGGFVASVPGTVNKVQGIASAISSGGGTLQGVPIPPTEIPCAVGIVTVSGEIFDPFTPTLTPLDFIESFYTDCDEGTGEIINGMVTMTVDAFAGDLALGVYDLTATFVLTNLRVTTATDDLTSNGMVTVALDTTMLPAIAASVSGSSLTTSGITDSETLSNFSAAQAVDAGLQPAPYTMDSSGTLDSSVLAGVINYSTPVTFQGFDFDYPSSGEFLVTSGTSSLRLIALDSVNVRIEINNDGVIEIIDTTWAAFAN